MNNDNPVSDDLDLSVLHVLPLALLLIMSNLPGFELVIYAHRMCQFVVSFLTFVAVFCSVLYHFCQTTDVCFDMGLPKMTLLDHISAPVFMIALILNFINSSSERQIKRRTRIRDEEDGNHRDALPPSSRGQSAELMPQPQRLLSLSEHHRNVDRFLSPSNFSNNSTMMVVAPINNTQKEPREPWHDEDFENSTYLTDEEFDYIEGSKMYYNQGYSMGAPNTLTSAWDVYILLASIFVAIIAALAHPFSMQAFIIVIIFNLLSIFYKIVIIEEGVPVNMYGRLYLPDLLMGIAMISVSLVFYILDCFWAYAYTHTLWHILSFMGSAKVISGLSRNQKNWYSPTFTLYRRMVGCCWGEREYTVTKN